MTKITPPTKEQNKGLSRTEAEMVMDLLIQADKRPTQGWRAVWRMTPTEIAEKYDLRLQDVLGAIRRSPVAV